MTREEKHLWYDFLRKLPFAVKRQQCIGKYIVDFYIPSKNIVIELDGSQHYETPGIKKDGVRDSYLSEQNIVVLRYPNNQVNQNFNGVCEDIARKCGIALNDFDFGDFHD